MEKERHQQRSVAREMARERRFKRERKGHEGGGRPAGCTRLVVEEPNRPKTFRKTKKMQHPGKKKRGRVPGYYCTVVGSELWSIPKSIVRKDGQVLRVQHLPAQLCLVVKTAICWFFIFKLPVGISSNIGIFTS